MAFGRYSDFTIQGSQVPSTQTNFPLTLVWTDARFKDSGNGGPCRPDGNDIRPYDATGVSALTYQKVWYNGAAGAFEFKILGASVATALAIRMKYGDSSLSSDGGSTSTWPSTYKIVLPFGSPSSLGLNDLTSNANDFTNANTVVASGKLGGAASFNGTNAKLTRNSFTVPTSGALTCWWKPTANPATTSGSIFELYTATGSKAFAVLPYNNGHIYAGWWNGANVDIKDWTEVGISSGTYYHIALVWTNGSNCNFLVDGSDKGGPSTLDATWDTSAQQARLGWSEQVGLFGTCDIDEFRLRDTQLSQDWITTEVNQGNQAAFWSLGSETVLSSGGGGPIILGGLTKGALIRGGRLVAE